MLQFIDLRLAVLGNVDAGKSTILGVLTQGELDNGRGRARLNLFRHLHEIQSGRTSSISHEILGFNSKGEVCSNGLQHICIIITKSAVFFLSFFLSKSVQNFICSTNSSHHSLLVPYVDLLSWTPILILIGVLLYG